MKFDDADEVGDEPVDRPLVQLGRAAHAAGCSPSRMTTMTSLIVSASSWSWVTYTNVIPTSRWRALSSSCISLRSLRSSAPSGSSRSSTVGSVDERPGERDALLLAARHLPRPPPLVARQADQRERLADPALLLVLADLALAQPVADVLGHVHVREQGVVLEDRVDVAPVRRDAGDRLAGEEDLALGRLLEAGDHPQRRGLAAARRAEERVELAAGDPQVHPVDGGDVAEPLRDPEDLDVGVRVRRSAGGRRLGASAPGRRLGRASGRRSTAVLAVRIRWR